MLKINTLKFQLCFYIDFLPSILYTNILNTNINKLYVLYTYIICNRTCSLQNE